MIHKIIAETDPNIQQVFGSVTPPPQFTPDISRFIGWGVNIFFLIMGLLTLYFFLMGAFDWLTSAGDEKKIGDARSKITNSALAMVLAIVLYVVWRFLVGDLLGIVDCKTGGCKFSIPSIISPTPTP